MHLLIYCDESSDKGRYFSNFYGGALLNENVRQLVEARLTAVKNQTALKGEIKWTKISAYNEKDYIAIVDEFFNILRDGLVKVRIMFTHNIHHTGHIKYENENEYFMLYYQFIKHCFGLRYCNPQQTRYVNVKIFLDRVPQKKEDFAVFKSYMSGLSDYPIFNRQKVRIHRDDITDVDSTDHIILQMVDVVLGSMNFRLNEYHREIPEGHKRRGARTRAKERVYKHINNQIQTIYPNFNIGVTTGQLNGEEDRWRHEYRHWSFVPKGSRIDLQRGKAAKKR